jgi:SAM-dependent methyltransferase
VQELKLTQQTRERLSCPCCRASLEWSQAEAICSSATCGGRFPIVEGVPVLIDESKSIFDIADFVERRETTFRTGDRLLKETFRGLMPRIGHNIKAAHNYQRFAEVVLAGRPHARVLVVGGGVLGKGMESLTDNPAIELVETDVALRPRTALIADGHNLPFMDCSFEGVIVQAVLEHVPDPHRCVGEIHRVLKERGIVYGETPFMQQVHMGPYDFTRFTHLGHRRLFRHFEELDSGVSSGPGMALAWSWQYFLLSFATRPLPRALLRGLAALTAFPLKYFDYFLVNRPGALDAASGIFFLGRKTDQEFTDRELVSSYRGAMYSVQLPRA